MSGNGILPVAALLLTVLTGSARAQQFTEIDPGLPNSLFPCAVWGDYDGDGDLDLLVTGLGSHDIAFTTIYKNTGGTFTNSGVVLPGLSRATAAWGDFDGDGDLDLAMTGLPTGSAAPVTRVYRNDGGTFAQVPGSFFPVFAGSIAWGDYDGDGDLDLLVTGLTNASAQGVAVTRLYRNDGGTFTSVAHPFPDCYSGAVAWGDYDNDGDLDVVITGTTNPAGLVAAIWRNDGGTFTNIGAPLPGMDLGFAVWGDCDNDGDLDLLFGGNSNDGFVTRIYRNDAGTFTDVNAGLLPVLWASAAWGDYDNDGDLDAVVMGYDPVAQVPVSRLYRNDAGTFVDSGVALHNLYLGTLSWADYDNDGDLDLLMAGNTAGTDILRLFRNNSSTSNAAPGPPAGLAVSLAGPTAAFSWTAPTDDHTPASGLSYNLRVGTSPGGSQVVSPHSLVSGYRRLPAMGNAECGLTAELGNLQPGTTYYWSVQAVDGAFAGSAFAEEGSFTYTITGVGDGGPATVAALSAAPNPFAGLTTIHYTLAAMAQIRLDIFDVSGRWVQTLVQGAQGAGGYAAKWDGLDQRGRPAPGGVYFARLLGGKDVISRRLVLAR